MQTNKHNRPPIKFNSKSPKITLEHVQASSSTKQKKKHVVSMTSEKQLTIAKNLMEEFSSVEQNSKEKEKEKPLSQQQQSKDESLQVEVLSESIIDIVKEQSRTLSDPYQIYLPNSYILGMKGLQQGIKARENELSKLRKKLKQQTNLYKATDADKEKAEAQNKQLKRSLEDSKRQITFLKETISEVKVQLTKQIKEKGVLQNQLKKTQQQASQNKNNIQSTSVQHQHEILTLKSDNEKLLSQIKYRQSTIASMKKDMSFMISQNGQQKVNYKNEIVFLRTELSKLKEEREKHIANIQMYHKDISILTQKVKLDQALKKEKEALEEKKTLDNIERQLEVNRQILKEVSFEQNIQRNRSKTMTAAKRASKYADIEENRRSQISDNYKATVMKKNGSTLSRADRSSSTMKLQRDGQNRANRRQLVGQMRELLRYEKELVSMNYQMQLLQKQMGVKCEGARRDQMQRNYGRLRRQIEKKQLQIAQMKSFLDNPLQRIK